VVVVCVRIVALRRLHRFVLSTLVSTSCLCIDDVVSTMFARYSLIFIVAFVAPDMRNGQVVKYD
jgi:hypothetical protein